MTQPKYLLAEHEGKEIVIRSRRPPLWGEVVPLGGGQISFDLAPHWIVATLSEAKIDKLTACMARWYHHAKGWPYSRIPTTPN